MIMEFIVELKKRGKRRASSDLVVCKKNPKIFGICR